MIFVLFFHVLAVILLGIFLATGYLSYLVRHSNKKVNNTRKSVKVLAVLGSGGHTPEMIELLKHLDPKIYSPRTYVVAESDSLSEIKINEFEKSRDSMSFTVEKVPRSREVGQSYISSVFTTIYATYYSFLIVWRYKPDLVLLNGPGTCIPIAFMAAFLDMVRLIDTCIIYEESLCRVHTLSLSGAILYYTGLADEVIVQWYPLLEKYPRTTFVEMMSI